MNKYKTRTGERISDATIKRRYSESLKKKHEGRTTILCECKGRNCTGQAVHNDHTISQKRLKEIGKVDLVYYRFAFVSSCNNCHQEWESYKDGEYLHHANHQERLDFMLAHDPDGFAKRELNR